MHGLSDITIHVRGQTETKFSLMVSLMIFVRSLKDLVHWISSKCQCSSHRYTRADHNLLTTITQGQG